MTYRVHLVRIHVHGDKAASCLGQRYRDTRDTIMYSFCYP